MSDFISSPTEAVKLGETLSNSDAIKKALEKGELYRRGFDDGYKRGKEELLKGKGGQQRMTNEEFEAMRNERTEELTQALIRNNIKIANIVRNAYERGYADGIDQQKKRQQITVLIGGEQVYPEQEEAENEQV